MPLCYNDILFIFNYKLYDIEKIIEIINYPYHNYSINIPIDTHV